MKFRLVLVIVALLAGAWLGLNFANDRPLLSNPLAERSVQEKAVRGAGQLLEESKRTLRERLE